MAWWLENLGNALKTAIWYKDTTQWTTADIWSSSIDPTSGLWNIAPALNIDLPSAWLQDNAAIAAWTAAQWAATINDMNTNPMFDYIAWEISDTWTDIAKYIFDSYNKNIAWQSPLDISRNILAWIQTLSSPISSIITSYIPSKASDIWNSDAFKDSVRMPTSLFFSTTAEKQNAKNKSMPLVYETMKALQWDNISQMYANAPTDQVVIEWIKATKDKVDWETISTEISNNEWVAQSLMDLSLQWEDAQYKRIKDAVVKQSWIQDSDIIEEVTRNYMAEQDKSDAESIRKSIAPYLKKWQTLTDSEAILIWRTIWQSVGNTLKAQYDYNTALDAERTKAVKELYPTRWKAKLDEYKKKADDVKAFNDAVMIWWLPQTDALLKKAHEDKNWKKFWEMQAYVSEARNSIANISGSLVDAPKTIREMEWKTQADRIYLTRLADSLEKSSIETTDRMKKFADIFGVAQYNSEFTREWEKIADITYIKDVIIKDGKYWIDWKDYSKEELEQIANDNTINWVAKRSELVAKYIVEESRKIPKLEWWTDVLPFSQRWNFWKSWIWYIVQKQKEFAYEHTSSLYNTLWYDALWVIWWAVDFVANVWENQVLTNPLRRAEDILWWKEKWVGIWLKDTYGSTLWLLWASNELSYNHYGTSFGNWVNSLVNFADEYGEAPIQVYMLAANPYNVWRAVVVSSAKVFNLAPRALAFSARVAWAWLEIWWATETAMWLYQTANKISKSTEFISKLEVFTPRAKWFTSALKNMTEVNLFRANTLITDAAQITPEIASQQNKLASVAAWKNAMVNSFIRETLENVVQDRIIANFMLWHTSTTYTDDDVLMDLWFSVSVPIITSLSKLVWVLWAWFKTLELWNIVDTKNKQLLAEYIKDPKRWLKEWKDFMVWADWTIMATNANGLNKVKDVEKMYFYWIQNLMDNIWNPDFQKAMSQAILVEDLVNKWRTTIAEWSRWAFTPEFVQFADTLVNESKLIADWKLSLTDVIAKKFVYAPDNNTVVDLWWSITWVWNNKMTRNPEQTVSKTFWLEKWKTFSEDEVNSMKTAAGISDSMFTKIEEDWTTKFKYHWDTATEIAIAKASWEEWIDDMIKNIPDVAFKDNIQIRAKILNDLDIC